MPTFAKKPEPRKISNPKPKVKKHYSDSSDSYDDDSDSSVER